MDAAVQKLYNDKVTFGSLVPGIPLKSAELHTFHQCVAVLDESESSTALLGAELTLTLHPVDVVYASMFSNLRTTITKNHHGSVTNLLASQLLNLMVQRRGKS